MTGQRLGDHAIVIGASIAGLAASSVLADHFAAVTLVERDLIDDSTRERRGVGQGAHLHTLLAGGEAALEDLFPGLGDRLDDAGAVRFRVGIEGVIHCPDGPFYNFGCTVREPFDFGVQLHNQSRGLLERCIRQQLLTRRNVRLLPVTTADALLGDRKYITGVLLAGDAHSGPLHGDLVVDAAGRSSHALRWLEALGASTPRETTVGVDFAYASARYRIPDSYAEGYRMMAFHGPAPRYSRAAALLEIEDRAWQVSLAGRFAEKPPTDALGFDRFIASLPTDRLQALLDDAERISDIQGYRFPRSVRRHYDELSDFPERLLVLGDALSSVNPVYGQGMSTAALEAKALGELLRHHASEQRGLAGLARPFFAAASAIIDTPWTLAAGADFLYPQTGGKRPRWMTLRSRFVDAMNMLSAEDAAVNQVMTEVFHLARPIGVLQHGALARRAWARVISVALGRAR